MVGTALVGLSTRCFDQSRHRWIQLAITAGREAGRACPHSYSAVRLTGISK